MPVASTPGGGVLQVVHGTLGIYPFQAFKALIYVSADTNDCQPVSHVVCETRYVKEGVPARAMKYMHESVATAVV